MKMIRYATARLIYYKSRQYSIVYFQAFLLFIDSMPDSLPFAIGFSESSPRSAFIYRCFCIYGSSSGFRIS